MPNECCQADTDGTVLLSPPPESGRKIGIAPPEGLDVEGRHPSVAHFGPLFSYAHLPEPLRTISAQVANTAQGMIDQLPDNPELSAGLRNLLIAKDSFVRVAVVSAKSRCSQQE